MKKTITLAILLLAMGETNAVAQEAPANGEEIQLNIPCLDESYYDENSAATWGVGRSSDMRTARLLATQDAIDAMARRFHINSETIGRFAQQWCMTTNTNANNECVVYVSIHVPKSVLYKSISIGQQITE